MENSEKNVRDNSFRVEVMGLIFDPKKRKVLIAKEEGNPYVNKTIWRFPGGKVSHKDKIESSLKKHLKEKTGYTTAVLGSVFARIPPEKKDLLLIYYLCEIVKGKEKPAKSFTELKWVSPTELKNYFTTKLEPALKECINHIK